MKLFLLSRIPEESEEEICLTGDDFHYLCRVRRLEPGARLRAKDREGRGYLLKLAESTKESCRFSIIEKYDNPSRAEREIHLFQALPKGKKMDLVVRQAAEAGVTSITPLDSDHSLVKIASRDRAAKKERWDRILREALQQSGSPVMTTVSEPCPFARLEEFITRGGVGFFCHQEEREEGYILPILQAAPPKAPIALIIGPEGGLSSKEVDNLEKWGYHSLYFGPNVLRTETASLYGVSAVKTVLRELL